MLNLLDRDVVRGAISSAQKSYIKLPKQCHAGYAFRLNGSYESLDGGHAMDALTDFTGGLANRHDLSAYASKDLLTIMLKAHAKGSLMCCSIIVSIICLN